MGVFAKFAAALVAIPSSVIGGMTTFLFCSVAVSGIAIITRGVPFNRRNRFILTAGMSLGYGATLVPNYFNNVFHYSRATTRACRAFSTTIVLVMETGFAVTAAVCMILNLMLPDEIEDEDVHGVPAEVPADGTATGKYDESARGVDSADIHPQPTTAKGVEEVEKGKAD